MWVSIVKFSKLASPPLPKMVISPSTNSLGKVRVSIKNSPKFNILFNNCGECDNYDYNHKGLKMAIVTMTMDMICGIYNEEVWTM
jgi:hypothetical protein